MVKEIFDHISPELYVMAGEACGSDIFQPADYSLEELVDLRKSYEEAISDWDCIIELQLGEDLDEYGLECLRSDRKSRQQAVLGLRAVKQQLKMMMKNKNKELIAI